MVIFNRMMGGTALLAAVAGVSLAACADVQPVGLAEQAAPGIPETALVAFDCEASMTGALTCSDALSPGGRISGALIGGQNVYVRLTSSNVSYDPGTEIFSFDVTVQNLMSEAIGTFDGVVPDPDGVRVFFASGPTATAGSGVITVDNPDGIGTFTGAGQPFFAYPEILPRNAVSSPKEWRLNVPSTVSTFAFTLYLETEIQPYLVINEVLANPGGPITDVNGEWFELYNAGTRAVDLQNLVIADSAASGRRPYHVISTSVVVPPGGYVTLGGSTDLTANGGVTIDYSYGTALALANSLDAIKISRVVGNDTITIDRVVYSLPGVSAKNGLSRELINPALDNTNLDGNNWADAAPEAVYGPGGSGTPRALNSAYLP